MISIHSFPQRVQPSAGQRCWKQDVESERKTYGLLSEGQSFTSISFFFLLFPLFFSVPRYFPSFFFLITPSTSHSTTFLVFFFQHLYFSPYSLYISAKSFKQSKNYNVVTFCFLSEWLQWTHAKKQHVFHFPYFILQVKNKLPPKPTYIHIQAMYYRLHSVSKLFIFLSQFFYWKAAFLQLQKK